MKDYYHGGLIDQKGFTLIELVVVMVLLGILAIVAIPRYLDLGQQAKISVTQASLGSVRSALHLKLAEASANSLPPVFPSSLAASDFANQQLPKNELTGIRGVTTVASAPSGTATSGSNGFWYIQATGQAGAYSDGSVDTSGW